MKKKILGKKTKLILEKGARRPWVAKITGLEKDESLKKEFLDACHENQEGLHFLCDEGYYEGREAKSFFIKVRSDGTWKNVDYFSVKNEMLITL